MCGICATLITVSSSVLTGQGPSATLDPVTEYLTEFRSAAICSAQNNRYLVEFVHDADDIGGRWAAAATSATFSVTTDTTHGVASESSADALAPPLSAVLAASTISDGTVADVEPVDVNDVIHCAIEDVQSGLQASDPGADVR